MGASYYVCLLVYLHATYHFLCMVYFSFSLLEWISIAWENRDRQRTESIGHVVSVRIRVYLPSLCHALYLLFYFELSTGAVIQEGLPLE